MAWEIGPKWARFSIGARPGLTEILVWHLTAPQPGRLASGTHGLADDKGSVVAVVGGPAFAAEAFQKHVADPPWFGVVWRRTRGSLNDGDARHPLSGLAVSRRHEGPVRHPEAGPSSNSSWFVAEFPIALSRYVP